MAKGEGISRNIFTDKGSFDGDSLAGIPDPHEVTDTLRFRDQQGEEVTLEEGDGSTLVS